QSRIPIWTEGWIPKDYKAGYQYGLKDWDYRVPGGPTDMAIKNSTEGHTFQCPLSQPYWHSNFCKGYDAALAYENSDY
ncbi:MAG: hypothetical protein WAM42_10000, partial [Candidatus Nitrosopolaris sp.]